MLKRIMAVTAFGLALGLAACDQGGQEQAQTPNRSRDQQQGATPSTPPPAAPATPEQAPPPPSGSGSQ